MPKPILERTIDISVDPASWGKKPVPPALISGSGVQTIDLAQAFHMLGTLTMPNGLSSASPALFWAWLRYYLAPAETTDLRITMDFADLDPHQKGILSDDFGVAIATKWMFDCFGGFYDIVDGRQFALQFPHLLKKKRKSKAKVGPSKAPDFVMRDISNKWHILECKGTQSDRDYQRKALKVGKAQKHAIQLVGTIKGEQLVSSLYIANEKSPLKSHLQIIDPERPPLINLTEDQAHEMELKARQVGIARAFGMIGLTELASEMTLPTGIDPESDLLRPSELYRLRQSREQRITRAQEQTRARRLKRINVGGQIYDGREARLELPPDAFGGEYRSVTVRQAVRRDLINQFSAEDALSENNFYLRAGSVPRDHRISLQGDANLLFLNYGGIAFSEVIWDKTPIR